MRGGQGDEKTSGNNKGQVKGVLRITKSASYMPACCITHALTTVLAFKPLAALAGLLAEDIGLSKIV